MLHVNKFVLTIIPWTLWKSDIFQKKSWKVKKSLPGLFVVFTCIEVEKTGGKKKGLGVEQERKVFSSGQVSKAMNHLSAQGWNTERGF